MLEQLPEYQALDLKKKWEVTLRLEKVYHAHDFRGRGPALRAEIKKIAEELRSKKKE